ncbi:MULTISPECIES: CidA/LrgA family protein [Limosilactobacillus]|uniref:Murein hydrolase regulator LrgA n=1 Tax=Limosilactobacillus pontis DSM 8475 TaxID=1423794 RepID=A0A922TI67_9LACO|nr:CidA/LrgA family protein [Limosilactobacillus pontis]HJA27864.1 CidA/LrgA family protein [Candidatus Limosilactobacillus intestinigallinarum]KRM35899.1 murein hydrolase regulator LrgA [Limosilactobacillus pontis DSM 8475]MCX2187222.1 CidA/LrgA family protein [Limosilactobacillus pontis]MCX2188567.1 CidA/LrgA family protein [Limosilactobacillus pontis]QFV01094.1 murein hydrolase regulator LrgA [Limosilactobacillus pontis]
MDKKDKKPEASNIYVQMGIFAAILFVSQLISDLFPKSFVVPTPLIGMVLLYILLACHIVKLHQVEKFGTFMIGLIAFLFVPSGIQLAAHLDIMRREGIQDVCVIIISTIILLVVIAYVGALVMSIHHKITGNKKD